MRVTRYTLTAALAAVAILVGGVYTFTGTSGAVAVPDQEQEVCYEQVSEFIFEREVPTYGDVIEKETQTRTSTSSNWGISWSAWSSWSAWTDWPNAGPVNDDGRARGPLPHGSGYNDNSGKNREKWERQYRYVVVGQFQNGTTTETSEWTQVAPEGDGWVQIDERVVNGDEVPCPTPDSFVRVTSLCVGPGIDPGIPEAGSAGEGEYIIRIRHESGVAPVDYNLQVGGNVLSGPFTIGDGESQYRTLPVGSNGVKAVPAGDWANTYKGTASTPQKECTPEPTTTTTTVPETTTSTVPETTTSTVPSTTVAPTTVAPTTVAPTTTAAPELIPPVVIEREIPVPVQEEQVISFTG